MVNGFILLSLKVEFGEHLKPSNLGINSEKSELRSGRASISSGWLGC